MWVVLLVTLAYLGAVIFAVVPVETVKGKDTTWDLDGSQSALWGLAHLPSLPLQLFFCLVFGNQVSE